MAPKVGQLPPVSDRRGSDDGALLFKGSAMTRGGAFAALSYITCAVLLVLFHKAALSSYNFPRANVITLFQMLATMESVGGVNVPMYTTLSHPTVVFTMIVEYLLTRQKYTRHVVGRLVSVCVRVSLLLCVCLQALVVVLLSCILAFFLSCSIFLNTTLNSALTQTMCSNLKDLFTVGLGWLLFGGLRFLLMW